MVVFLVILLIALVAATVWLLVFFASQTHNDKYLEKAENTVREAEQEASRLVGQASSKSHEIIEGTQYITEKTEETLRKILEESIARIASENASQLERVASHYEETARTAMAEAETVAKNHIESFTGALQQQTKKAENSLEELMRQEYQTNANELRAFKEAKMADIEKKLNEKIPLLIKTIAGKAIPLNEQQQIIKSALMKIKQEDLL